MGHPITVIDFCRCNIRPVQKFFVSGRVRAGRGQTRAKQVSGCQLLYVPKMLYTFFKTSNLHWDQGSSADR
jgi:hypothetical protein